MNKSLGGLGQWNDNLPIFQNLSTFLILLEIYLHFRIRKSLHSLNTKGILFTFLKSKIFWVKKKGVAKWDLEGPISSSYFSPLLTPLFYDHPHRVFIFGVLLYAILESCNTDFAGQVVHKPWVLPVSSQTHMPITSILIPATDCVLLLHQLVIGPVTIHLM